MANANLTWETTYSHNLGLDFGFWRNRLSGSVEVYQNTTEDILMRYPVSGSGYSFQYRNAGTIRNRGLEVSVAAVLAEKAKWGVNFNANIAFQPAAASWIWPDWRLTRSRRAGITTSRTTTPCWAGPSATSAAIRRWAATRSGISTWTTTTRRASGGRSTDRIAPAWWATCVRLAQTALR